MRHAKKDIPDREWYPDKIQRMAVALAAEGMDWEEALDAIASAKDMDPGNRAVRAWFLDHLPALEARLGREKFLRAREACACCTGGKRHSLARAIRMENPTYAQRLEALGDCGLIVGHGVERRGDAAFRVHFFPDGLTRYTCVCLRCGPEALGPMPASYCACCGGHIRRHCETALGVRLEQELVSSALTSCGALPCVFELRPQDGARSLSINPA